MTSLVSLPDANRNRLMNNMLKRRLETIMQILVNMTVKWDNNTAHV